MKIFGICFLVGTVGVGYLLLHSVIGLEEVTANMIGFTLGMISMVIWDIRYRRQLGRGLDDVGVSSFFGLLPTWLAGILLWGFMMVGLLQS